MWVSQNMGLEPALKQLWAIWVAAIRYLDLGTRVKSSDSSKLKGHIKMLLAWAAKALPMGKAANLC